MIFKSIKWRLQIWYGIILVVVLAGLGLAAYQLERGKMYREVDNELAHRLNIIAQALHHPERPPPSRQSQRNDFEPVQMPPDDNISGTHPPMVSGKFELSSRDEALFDNGGTNGFYYVVIGRDGKEIARSTNAPAENHEIVLRSLSVGINQVVPHMPRLDEGPKYNDKQFVFENFPTHGISPGQPFPPYMRGTFREVMIMTPPGEWIVVGRNVVGELAALRLIGLQLAGVSGIILFFGLAGGWWISSRAIRPIEDISATAVKISAGDLSQRINVAEAESELGRLATVLNSTFARLEIAFAQQQQFTADAAHELRTPVSVMLTQTQTALNRERSGAEYRETLEACQRASQRMRKLVESLLELARIDAGQEAMKRLPCDLSRMVRDCVASVRPLADEQGVKIHCDLPPIECGGDSDRLAQVLVNLLANAIQYNRPNGEVRVAGKIQNGLAVLTVSDTGRGIPAKDLPHIFERFYRADASRSAGHAGLGLAIAKAMIEAHGGTIEVSSQENAGTTFTVRLPAKV